MLCAGAQAQRPKNLVFEGAGIRGIAYAGAVKELEAAGLLKDVQRVGGTSAGAVTAMLLSVGYSADELAVIVNSTPFKKLNDGRFFFIGGTARLRKYFGWYRGRQTEDWLAGLLQTKTGNANITFGQLREKGYKDLYVTGTSLNRQSSVVFSAERYPAMKVRDAVRISVSIPLYFEPVFLDSNGTVVRHPKNTAGLDVMVDGGITANFPIKIFDSTKYLDAASPNRFAVNPQTIGFRIDRAEQVEADAKGLGLVGVPVENLQEYISAFYRMAIENLNRQTLTAHDWQRTVSIADGDVGPRVRKLSAEEVRTLVNNGAAGWHRYLAR